MLMTPFLFTLLALATYRVVRLGLYDRITERPRDAIYAWLTIGAVKGNKAKAWLLDLLTCQWCVGIWVSFAVVIGLAAYQSLPFDWRTVLQVFVVALALAAAQSLLHQIEDALSVED